MPQVMVQLFIHYLTSISFHIYRDTSENDKTPMLVDQLGPVHNIVDKSENTKYDPHILTT